MNGVLASSSVFFFVLFGENASTYAMRVDRFLIDVATSSSFFFVLFFENLNIAVALMQSTWASWVSDK